ncbi:hypothetical protein [Rhodobacteraceae bacterium DSL-40]|uniref:hypothetical protein n=1 Tax=Amaricoccus sp. B4 TaxID=3368557 RepID=UPI000DAE28B0
MAELPDPRLIFDNGCPDCGERQAVLPPPIPGVPDNFDWKARDYDSLRLFLMQELAHRFPERRRWTPADMEVVIVELLAAAFDRASHAIDAVQAERYLDSARRPQSVRRLLKLIGYDAAERVRDDVLAALPPVPGGAAESREEKLERLWRLEPARMEAARAEGPRRVAEQQRMVTLEDCEAVLSAHPLVARAQARLVWTGAWNTILVSALLEADRDLDTALPAPGTNAEADLLWGAIRNFHLDNGLALPPEGAAVTPRRLLRILIERRRMIGSEVFLETAKPAAIAFTLSVRAKPGYFRSEMRQALADVFSADEGGFFEPGRLDFGEDLFASDIIDAAMAVEGVAVACLNRFKRVGSGWPDRSAAGFIPVADDEYVRCLNRRGAPETGYFRLIVNGGEVG